MLETLRVNGTLKVLVIDDNTIADDLKLIESIDAILLENKNLQGALPYAGLSLELASGLVYPVDVMNVITQELAFLPPSRREEGRATIKALGAAIQPPANNH